MYNLRRIFEFKSKRLACDKAAYTWLYISRHWSHQQHAALSLNDTTVKQCCVKYEIVLITEQVLLYLPGRLCFCLCVCACVRVCLSVRRIFDEYWWNCEAWNVWLLIRFWCPRAGSRGCLLHLRDI